MFQELFLRVHPHQFEELPLFTRIFGVRRIQINSLTMTRVRLARVNRSLCHRIYSAADESDIGHQLQTFRRFRSLP